MIRTLLERLSALVEAESVPVHYLGVFLNQASRAKLFNLLPPEDQLPNKSGDHVTILHRDQVGGAAFQRAVQAFRPKLGRPVTFEATRLVVTSRIQAVVIRGIETARGTPHVTLAWAPGVSPAEANDVVGQDPGQPIQPWIKLAGVFDTFPRQHDA